MYWRKGRFETVYSPFSAKPQYTSVIPLKTFILNCSSATLFLFFGELPGPESHTARIKIQYSILVFYQTQLQPLKLQRNSPGYSAELFLRHQHQQTYRSFHCFSMNRSDRNDQYGGQTPASVKTASQVFRGISCLITHEYGPVNLNNT